MKRVRAVNQNESFPMGVATLGALLTAYLFRPGKRGALFRDSVRALPSFRTLSADSRRAGIIRGIREAAPVAWLALLLLACRGNSTKHESGTQVGGVHAETASATVARVVDSTPAASEHEGFFDPNGFYFPTSDVVQNGYELSWLDLKSVEYFYDGSLHYDAPRFPTPEARLEFKGDSTFRVICNVPMIRPDTLVIECPSTKLGTIRFAGHFLDREGRFWNRPELSNGGKVLLTGILTIQGEGQTFSHAVEFVYREGD